MSTQNTETKFEDGNLIVTRIYEAPRELVFEAWIETSKVQQWWGCGDCEEVRSEIEPKVGGCYNHHMTLKGGHDVPGFATLTIYEPPEKLAFSSSMPGPEELTMTVTVTFTEVDGGTRVQLVHAGIPDIKVEGDMEMREIVRGGWTDAFGKLGTLLGAPSQT